MCPWYTEGCAGGRELEDAIRRVSPHPSLRLKDGKQKERKKKKGRSMPVQASSTRVIRLSTSGGIFRFECDVWERRKDIGWRAAPGAETSSARPAAGIRLTTQEKTMKEVEAPKKK